MVTTFVRVNVGYPFTENPELSGRVGTRTVYACDIDRLTRLVNGNREGIVYKPTRFDIEGEEKENIRPLSFTYAGKIRDFLFQRGRDELPQEGEEIEYNRFATRFTLSQLMSQRRVC